MDQSPAHKKPRLQGFWELGKTKLFFALLSAKMDKHGTQVCGREYNIFIVDINDFDEAAAADPNCFPPISPYIHIDCGPEDVLEDIRYVMPEPPIKDVFCLLGNILYMFEGYRFGSKISQFVFVIDMSTPLRLVKSNMQKACEMLSPKCDPGVIPSPDGRHILVFPTKILIPFDEGCYPMGGLELFDCEKLSSKELPKIEIACSVWRIEAYGFINDTTLLAQFESHMFVLDLLSLDKGWIPTAKILTGIECLPVNCLSNFRTSNFEIIENRFYIATTYGVYDLEERENDEHAITPFVVPEVLDPGVDIQTNYKFRDDYFVALLNHDEKRGECHFCELMVQCLREGQSSCCFEIHVGCLNLDRYKQDQAQGVTKLKEEYTDSVRVLRFCLDLGGEYLMYVLPMFFPLPRLTT